MAFNQIAPNTRPAGQNESWRKDAFLNFSLPDGKGNLVKLGSIGLKMSKVRERKLIEWLMGDASKTEERCAMLIKQLIMEIRNAEPDEDSGFALPEDPVPATGTNGKP